MLKTIISVMRDDHTKSAGSSVTEVQYISWPSSNSGLAYFLAAGEVYKYTVWSMHSRPLYPI